MADARNIARERGDPPGQGRAPRARAGVVAGGGRALVALTLDPLPTGTPAVPEPDRVGRDGRGAFRLHADAAPRTALRDPANGDASLGPRTPLIAFETDPGRRGRDPIQYNG